MNTESSDRPVVTIGGQEVTTLDEIQAERADVGTAADIQIALEPQPERVVYQYDRAPGKWTAGLAITLFALTGITVIAATIILIVRAARRHED